MLSDTGGSLARTTVEADMLDERIRAVMARELGKSADCFNVDVLASLAASLTASAYVTRHMAAAVRCAHTAHLLDYALQQVSFPGLIVEFGVFSANSTNFIADRSRGQTVFGFDSFQGLPETWRPGFEKGVFARVDLPAVRPNVQLVQGWFDRTLPAFVEQIGDRKISFLHVDCDLYSSTQTVFASLKDFIVPGTIIVFDEYLNYPGWERHEFLAFQQFVEATALRYRYIGLVPSHQQVAVKVL